MCEGTYVWRCVTGIARSAHLTNRAAALTGRTAIEMENRGCLATASKRATAAWTGGWARYTTKHHNTAGTTTAAPARCNPASRPDSAGWQTRWMWHVHDNHTVISALVCFAATQSEKPPCQLWLTRATCQLTKKVSASTNCAELQYATLC